MVISYVLLDTIDIKERQIRHDLQKIPGITEVDQTLVEETAMADPLFENYNIIAKIEANSMEEIEQIVNNKIHNMLGIKKLKISSKPSLK